MYFQSRRSASPQSRSSSEEGPSVPRRYVSSENSSDEEKLEEFFRKNREEIEKKKKFEERLLLSDSSENQFVVSDDHISSTQSSESENFYRRLENKTKTVQTKRILEQAKKTYRSHSNSSSRSSDSFKSFSSDKENSELSNEDPSEEDDSPVKTRKPFAKTSDNVPKQSTFKKSRDVLTAKYFDTFNKNVFDSKLPTLEVKWNPRLTKTAGRCRYRLIQKHNRVAVIELSTKVVDREERLRDTFLHELCHAATWLIDEVKESHGTHFKTWAHKAKKIFPEIPLVTRCHSYKIECKFRYRCVEPECPYSIGRHSKSLDVTRYRCPYCKGKLALDGENEAPKRKANPFAVYVKENMAQVRKDNRGKPIGDVMKILSAQFAATKI